MQFKVYKPPPRSPASLAFLLVVQSDLVDIIDTVVVVTMVTKLTRTPVARPNPRFTIANTSVFLDPAMLATVDRRTLGAPVANLGAHRDQIVAALDLLFTGI